MPYCVRLLWGGNLWADVKLSGETNGTLTITVTESTSNEDANSLESYMSGNSFKEIVFTGDGKVTNEFVAKLNNNVSNVTVLNMGGVTIEDLSSSSIPTGLDFSKLTELTVPKTKVADEKMTFPKAVFNESESSHIYEWNGQDAGITKLIFPEGYTEIADEVFPNSYGFKWIQALGLPSTLKTIGKKAFVNKANLTEVTFPANLDKIDDAAFANTPLKKLKFNNKLRFIGNSAFSYTSEITEETLIIPASVKYIGPWAFNFRQYQDVYFQGTKAPIMPFGKSVVADNSNSEGKTAFSANTLMGNNGFNTNGGKSNHDNANEGWANRDNYYNNSYYFCVLHYPKTLTNNDDIDTYVDVTRKYITKTEGTFNYADTYTVGQESTALANVGQYGASKNVAYGYKDTYLGEQYIWPSQTQWMRAYVTAANGLRWDGTTKYRPTLSDEDKNIYAEAGYAIGTGEGQYTEDELSKMAHMGTRMFVLANADGHGEKYDPSIKKDGTWWTLCVPFNMTKKQVLDAFGDKTQLYLFTSVTREIDVNNRNHILIRFATDPLAHNTAYTNGDNAGKKAKFETSENATQESGHIAGEWDYSYIDSESNTNVGDDDIVIWAHESYMIKPMNGESSDQEATSIVINNYEPVPGNPQPSVVRAKTIKKTQDNTDYENCYRFIGNYISDEKMPQYCYFYGTTQSDKNEKFRFLTGTNSTWKPNKSLIEAHAHDGGAEDYKNFFGGNTSNTTNEAKVMQTTLFGFDEDDNTTGIDDVKIVIGSDTLAPIFSLDGKLVSASGDTTGLAKGIYVKAGKKFVVK